MSQAGLYVHVPFCKSKCPYCGFYSETNFALVPDWLRAIQQEAQRYGDQFGVFDTLYIGGGTPSTLDAATLEALLSALRKVFQFCKNSENTIEVNPADVNADALALWKSLGLMRLSLGVQSFDDHALSFLQRRHNAAQANAALNLIRSSGDFHLGIDLIFGLPQQTQTAWMADVEKALQVAPEHLSCYQLTIDAHTPFARRKAAGQLTELGEEEQAALQAATSEFLQAQGYVHYEISNFARQDRFRSKHNQKYWHHHQTLGLGPSAHSFQHQRRFWNIQALDGYLQALREGQRPCAGEEQLSKEQLRLETIFLGLRTKEGVDLTVLGSGSSVSGAIERLIGEKLAVVWQGRLRPTLKGFLVADRLPLLFC